MSLNRQAFLEMLVKEQGSSVGGWKLVASLGWCGRGTGQELESGNISIFLQLSQLAVAGRV